MTDTAVVNDVNTRTIKNFKSSPDIENFYRFIHENNLRDETKKVLTAIVEAQKPPKRKRKKRTKKIH